MLPLLPPAAPRTSQNLPRGIAGSLKPDTTKPQFLHRLQGRGDVRKVPRDQVFHAIAGGHRNVNRVNPSLGRNRARSEQLVRDRVDGRVQSEYRDPFEKRHTSGGGDRVAAGGSSTTA